jgi:hypothetical protein
MKQFQIDEKAKPYTHLNFKNDPDEFQFAIITDNSGGARPGVFEILSNVVDQQFIGGEYPWSGHEQVLSGRLGLEHLSSAVRELDSCCD